MLGTTLGSYRVLEKLGEGGMGEVYRAHDDRLGRDVALKVLPADVTGDAGRLERFDREARAIAALNHPHIVTIYSTEDAGGVRFMTMELVEGQTLDASIVSGGMPVGRFLEIAIPLADALAAAHQKQITHRDLKPGNVMLSRDGRIKVLDFGLARVGGGEITNETDVTRAALTHHGTIIGTMPYMSPEQVEGRVLDPRTDLFSLGVMFYELLCGERPFKGASAPALMSAILRDTPSRIGGRPGVPDGLDRLIGRLLEKRPEDRPQTALDLLNELRQVQRQLESGHERAEDTSGAASIVVLPFANRSPDAGNEYFSDGLTEEIIADLSKVGALRVISKTTAMRLKGTDQDLAAIAARLKVRYALEGSVRKAGTSLRITTQLVDTATDMTIWSEKFSGTLEDIFEIQERVSRAIVQALRVELTDRESRSLLPPSAPNAYVYDIYLRARGDIWSFLPDRLGRAEADLHRAATVAGEHVLLYAALGLLHWQYINSGISADRGHLTRAAEYAHKIIALDPSSASGPQLLGLIASQEARMGDSIRHLTRALEIDPHDPYSRIWLAFGWTFTGAPERARPLFDRMLATDPLFDYLMYGLGLDAYLSGDYLRAETWYDKVRQLSPDHPGMAMVYAQALASAQQHERMARVVNDIAPQPAAHPLHTLGHILKHAVLGEAEAADALMSPELEASLWGDPQYAHVMAQAQAQLGRPAEAMRWLRQAVERGFLHHDFLMLDPLLVRLRDEPGFTALMTSVQAAASAVKARADSRRSTAGS